MLRCAASKKEPKKSVGTLVRGDNESEVIRIEIARNIEGVDLSDFIWSVKYTNSAGQTDIDVLDVEEVNSHDIILLWTPGGAATSEPGITSFEIEGIDGERVWQSATQYIELLDDLDGEPNYDPEEMSEVQRLIRFTKDEINALYSASETATAAAAAANSAASEADAAAERANEAATSSDHGRVVALEKFTFDPEPYAHTGDIVQLDNYENMPMNVVTHIEPVQEGSGDPYPGGGGKNLQPNDATTKTQNGVTFTGNRDGTIIVNGTATSDIYYNLPAPHVTVGETYILTGCPAGGGSSTYRLYHKYRDSGGNYANDYGDGVTFTEENGTYVTTIFIASGQTVSNLVFKPMIRLATDADATYVPYSNIRPITGNAEDVLTRCGKNLFDFTEITNKHFGSDPITLTITGSTVELKGTPSTKYRQALGTFDATGLAGKTVTLSGQVSGDYPYAVCQFKDSEGAIKTTIALTSSGSNTGTVDETCVTANFVMCLNQSSFGEECTATYSNIQLELGSAATEYETYNGGMSTADFGQTVYGGTYDWNTGVLTVDRAMITLNGGENWVNGYASDGVNNRFELNLLDSGFGHAGETSNTIVDDAICDAFGYYKTKRIPPVSKFRVVQTNNSIWMLFNPPHNTVPLEDVSAWKVWLAANPITVVMPLIEPTTIQLTPQEILALGGVNTLYAEAGDITVSGRKDILYLTDYLLNKLKSIEETN